MKILSVVPWDQKQGGVASAVGNLAVGLTQLGHDVTFFYPDDDAMAPQHRTTSWGFPGITLRLGLPRARYRFLSWLGFPASGMRILYRLYRVILSHHIQIVNIHYPVDACVYFAICRFLLPFKLVVSIHGTDIFPGGKPRARYSFPTRILLRRSDLVVANSQSFRADFIREFPHLEKKTIFIHNGVNPEEFGLVRRDPERAQDPQNRYVLCIANHNEKKAVDVLIRATALLTALKPPFKLMLVGDGPLRGQLEALAASLGLEHQVIFLGSQGREEVRNLLHGCEVFTLPSRSEPFGIAVIEAMACGKPVLATAIGGIAEIVESGTSGILVEPDNAAALAHELRRLLSDDQLRKRLGEAGYKRVMQHFCISHTVTGYERAFTSLNREQPVFVN